MIYLKSLFEAAKIRFSLPRLTIAITIPLVAGAIGAFFTSNSVETWYQTIGKPWFTPPNWIFGPAWGVLYILMGMSLYLVWRKTTTDKTKQDSKPQALASFGTQLILNVVWSFLFFGLRSPQIAFAEILILLASIIVTIIIFSRVSKLSSILLLPYVGWITFASVLNLWICFLNP